MGFFSISYSRGSPGAMLLEARPAPDGSYSGEVKPL